MIVIDFAEKKNELFKGLPSHIRPGKEIYLSVGNYYSANIVKIYKITKDHVIVKPYSYNDCTLKLSKKDYKFKWDSNPVCSFLEG